MMKHFFWLKTDSGEGYTSETNNSHYLMTNVDESLAAQMRKCAGFRLVLRDVDPQ
jgi:hypothetical protein